MLELLPEDVLIIILRKLDFKSQSNLCEALKSIRRIFMEYKITKECDLSLSTSATVKTLRTQFFKIIAPHLWKLNLSAEKFDATVKNNFPVRDNGHIMLWMKDAHTFDEVFFKQLHKTIRQFLVYFTLDTWNSNCIPNYDRFCITPRENDSSSTQSSVEVGFKRKRIVKENYVLDYDKYFQEKNEVELSLMFSLYVLKTAITFNSECEYLKKLTYLSLVGAEKYTATFFNTLFRSCIKLVTLNVAIGNLNANDVVRSAPLSHTIKNLRIVAKMIDFNSVLTSLSQCPSLENVHIVDLSITSSSMIFDPTTIVQKCVNLYCVHIIYAFELSKNKQAKQLKIIEDIKTKFHKPYLSFKLFNSTGVYHESKPFIDVFKIN
ncbi:uncharacterized protein LOC121730619 [Aricia agestis]|uniref:uncharacterized protein LOC121730619 n=1 Tax=Aricia agestis TaxID=91739 RepID=UPI001C206B18|nr:uncharacterized protein LOC121730619 [Aricia agestis]